MDRLPDRTHPCLSHQTSHVQSHPTSLPCGLLQCWHYSKLIINMLFTKCAIHHKPITAWRRSQFCKYCQHNYPGYLSTGQTNATQCDLSLTQEGDNIFWLDWSETVNHLINHMHLSFDLVNRDNLSACISARSIH